MYNPDMREIIIITGASSGMGACFARQLVNENCEMWLIARRKERLEELSKELNEKRTALSNENPVKAIAMDISGRKGVEEFEAFLHSANSREELKIAYLINNAGFGTYGRSEERRVGKECRSRWIFFPKRRVWDFWHFCRHSSKATA